MVNTTRAQRESLHRIWLRYHGPDSDRGRTSNGETYRQFRARVSPGMGWIGITPIASQNFYLGIEPDGYAHSCKGFITICTKCRNTMMRTHLKDQRCSTCCRERG